MERAGGVALALEVADDSSELTLWVKIFGADAGGASKVLWHQSWGDIFVIQQGALSNAWEEQEMGVILLCF